MPTKKERINTPTIFVLFGITGDLAQKKVLPALFELYLAKKLPRKMSIIGFSHRDIAPAGGDGDDGIRTYVKEVLVAHNKKYKKTDINSFIKQVHYQQGDFTSPEDMGVLAEHVLRIEDRFKQCANKLYHLAVPPKYYKQLFINIAHAGLSVPCSEDTGWARILVEKPFGKDVQTAQALDRQLTKIFAEEQIFRIDHYLAKEMIQDILLFRFSNSIFDPIWNHRYIDRVEIDMIEEIDIEDRGSFYDGVGALRDAGQNHVLQMLALIAMERPAAFTASDIRMGRAKVLSQLRPITGRSVAAQTQRAQYKGYRQEHDVDQLSTTETAFRIDCVIDNQRWGGVPFRLTSGKALNEKRNEIRIYFTSMQQVEGVMPCANQLTFTIQPTQQIKMLVGSKKPGFGYEIEEEELVLTTMNKGSDVPAPYERVMYDALLGEQLIFPSSHEVVAAWRFVTPILKQWDKGKGDLLQYKHGATPQEVFGE